MLTERALTQLARVKRTTKSRSSALRQANRADEQLLAFAGDAFAGKHFERLKHRIKLEHRDNATLRRGTRARRQVVQAAVAQAKGPWRGPPPRKPTAAGNSSTDTCPKSCTKRAIFLVLEQVAATSREAVTVSAKLSML